eukprot:1157853-Pelagomonas_calceolata.AAC.6
MFNTSSSVCRVHKELHPRGELVPLNRSRDPLLYPYFNVCRIHKELPPGGVLVFLNGQREVEYLCAKLRQHFAPAKRRHPLPSHEAAQVIAACKLWGIRVQNVAAQASRPGGLDCPKV